MKKRRIFYETKSGKTVSLEINLEETMQHVTEKIRDKEGIRLCNVSFTKINICCYFGNSDILTSPSSNQHVG